MEDNSITSNNDTGNSEKMPLVDYENFDFSNDDELLSGTNIGEVPSTVSIDSLFDDLLKDNHGCTHIHTCNRPGPDLPHTHTCVHLHTKVVTPPSNKKNGDSVDSAESDEQIHKKWGRERGGNREAVRKYRQKRKAYTASLEAEVVKLRALNQRLMKKLQGQVALEAEVGRLRCLLVDVRGRIEGEIGSFPYPRPVKSRDMYQRLASTTSHGSYMVPCNAQCVQVGFPHDGKTGKAAALNGQNFDGCKFDNLACLDLHHHCSIGNVITTVDSSVNAS